MSINHGSAFALQFGVNQPKEVIPKMSLALPLLRSCVACSASAPSAVVRTAKKSTCSLFLRRMLSPTLRSDSASGGSLWQVVPGAQSNGPSVRSTLYVNSAAIDLMASSQANAILARSSSISSGHGLLQSLRSLLTMEGSALSDMSFWLSSTLKKRKTKMNKHKLQKRRKKERLKSK